MATATKAGYLATPSRSAVVSYVAGNMRHVGRDRRTLVIRYPFQTFLQSINLAYRQFFASKLRFEAPYWNTNRVMMSQYDNAAKLHNTTMRWQQTTGCIETKLRKH